MRLFINNNLFQYFKKSNFFDYTNLFTPKNKFKLNNISEMDTISNNLEINSYQTLRGFNNNLKINKNIIPKIEKDTINLKTNINIMNNFKKKCFDNINDISKIKLEKNENKYFKRKYKNNKQITRISSLPFLNNNFYKININ